MNISIRKTTIVAAIAIMAVAIALTGITNTNVKATPQKEIGANITAPKGAEPGDETTFKIKLKGTGTSAEFLIDFGDNIEFKESEFFAFPEDDWPVEKGYELSKTEEGKYIFKAEDFEGTIIIEAVGIFQDDGINTVSVFGNYYNSTGAETALDVSYDTTVGEGLKEEPEEEPTEEITEPSSSEDSELKPLEEKEMDEDKDSVKETEPVETTEKATSETEDTDEPTDENTANGEDE